MDGCIYRTKDGECDLYAEGGKFTAFCDMEHCDNIAPTNADRIRAMTDEELAEWIYQVQDEDALRKENCLPPLSKSWWFDWLQREGE